MMKEKRIGKRRVAGSVPAQDSVTGLFYARVLNKFLAAGVIFHRKNNDHAIIHYKFPHTQTLVYKLQNINLNWENVTTL